MPVAGHVQFTSSSPWRAADDGAATEPGSAAVGVAGNAGGDAADGDAAGGAAGAVAGGRALSSGLVSIFAAAIGRVLAADVSGTLVAAGVATGRHHAQHLTDLDDVRVLEVVPANDVLPVLARLEPDADQRVAGLDRVIAGLAGVLTARQHLRVHGCWRGAGYRGGDGWCGGGRGRTPRARTIFDRCPILRAATDQQHCGKRRDDASRATASQRMIVS